MTTSLMFFELVRVARCANLKQTPHTRNKRKLNCVKTIFILIGTTLTSAQSIWWKSSTWLSLILSGTSNINQMLYRFEQVPYLLCWKLGRTLSIHDRFACPYIVSTQVCTWELARTECPRDNQVKQILAEVYPFTTRWINLVSRTRHEQLTFAPLNPDNSILLEFTCVWATEIINCQVCRALRWQF